MKETIEKILDHPLIETSHFTITVASILAVIVIVIIARLIYWLLARFLNREVRLERLEATHSYTIKKVSKYLISIVTIILILQSLNVNLTVLLGASAALFVGLGLGLQDIFKDSFAGLVILYSNVIRVGDIIEVDELIGEVQEIDIRSTKLKTRESIIIILPNHKLILEKVINWSKNQRVTRFSIDIGVAYGSDTALVKEILIQEANKHKSVTRRKETAVLFQDFGDSALLFQLYFYSDELFEIEWVKSDLRFSIDKAFREAGISIPFPQRDMHIINNK